MAWLFLPSGFWFGSTRKKGREMQTGEWSAARGEGQAASSLASLLDEWHSGRLLTGWVFLCNCRPCWAFLTVKCWLYSLGSENTTSFSCLLSLSGVVTAFHLGKLWVIQYLCGLSTFLEEIPSLHHFQNSGQGCLLFFLWPWYYHFRILDTSFCFV